MRGEGEVLVGDEGEDGDFLLCIRISRYEAANHFLQRSTVL